VSVVGQQTWSLCSIEIHGFLGVGDDGLTVQLDRPVTILIGPNGSGKSTILEAVEWALFGITAVGAAGEELRTPNLDAHRMYIHRGSPEAAVHLEFAADGHALEWRRTRRHTKPRPGDDAVVCNLDGEPVVPDPNELFGVTGELFRRAVAPGQGALQALISGDKTKRDAALDRLFGVELLNNLTLGLSKARFDLESERRGLRAKLDGFRSGLRSEITRRFDERTAARSAALDGEATAEMLTPAAAAASAEALGSELEVAVETRGGDLATLRETFASLRTTADARWSGTGPGERETRLLEVAQTATAHRDRWQKAVSDRLDEETEFGSLVESTGTEEHLDMELGASKDKLAQLEASLNAMNSRIAVLSSAREWIAAQPVSPEEEIECPVCERPMIESELAGLIDVVLASLAGADGEASAVQERVEGARKQIRELSANLDAVSQKREQVGTLAKREQALATDIIHRLRGHAGQLPAQPDVVEAPVATLVKEVLLLGASIAPDGSSLPTPALNDLLGRLAVATRSALQQTQGEIAQTREAAQAAREKVLSLERTIRFLEAEAQLDELDSAVGNVELATASAALDAVDSGVETLLAVIQVADGVSQAEAQARIADVAPRLSSWYERLSSHDSLRGARIDVTTRRDRGGSRNSYSICATSDDGWETGAGPMLSGGYQTVLAVAALCALSDDERSRTSLGLLALDEPTQSLDPDMTTRMGHAVARINVPRLFLTTTEETFADAATEGAGASQVRVIRLRDWTAAGGTRTEGNP